jgi:Sec-independent protein translocase protein TatA
MGRSLGRGMREFKDSVTGKDDDDDVARRAEITPGDDTQVVRTTATPREHDA